MSDDKRDQDVATTLASVASLRIALGGAANETTEPLSSIALGLDDIAAILDLLEAAGAGRAGITSARAALEDARKSVERANQVIVAHSGPPVEAPLRAVDMAIVLDDAIRIVAKSILRRARLTRIETDRFSVMGSERRLLHVVVNLLLYACCSIDDDSRSRSEVRVEMVRLDHDRGGLRITDTGPGIAAADVARLFDPGFFAGNGPGRAGLSLGASHEIVTSFGGALEVEHTSDRGTQFLLALRLAP